VTKTLADGTGLNAFRKDFKLSWPGTAGPAGPGEGSQAGVAWRTKVIYQTNMATSYAAGRYQH
jgi:nicotinamide mononucleotide (NMN) deamidase PncC